jgi:drug/metabolite transporter (DMT)-like permease
MSSPPAVPDRAALASRPALSGYVAVLLAAACWGMSGVFVQFTVASSGITALALAFWRDLFTFVLLLIGVGVVHPAWLRVQRRDLPWLLGTGLSLAAFHVLWNLGVLLNGVAVATVQQAAMPAIVALVAWLAWRESLTWVKGLAILLTFCGTALISGIDALRGADLLSSRFLIGWATPLTYASWNLFGKRCRASYHPLAVLTYAFAFATLALLPLQFTTPQPWPVPSTSWIWFAGLIVISTIVAFSAYVFGLGRLPASVASIVAMSEILFVSVYAWFLLGEILTVDQALGATLVIAGVLLLSWRGARSH